MYSFKHQSGSGCRLRALLLGSSMQRHGRIKSLDNLHQSCHLCVPLAEPPLSLLSCHLAPMAQTHCCKGQFFHEARERFELADARHHRCWKLWQAARIIKQLGCNKRFVLQRSCHLAQVGKQRVVDELIHNDLASNCCQLLDFGQVVSVWALQRFEVFAIDKGMLFGHHFTMSHWEVGGVLLQVNAMIT